MKWVQKSWCWCQFRSSSQCARRVTPICCLPKVVVHCVLSTSRAKSMSCLSKSYWLKNDLKLSTCGHLCQTESRDITWRYMVVLFSSFSMCKFYSLSKNPGKTWSLMIRVYLSIPEKQTSGPLNKGMFTISERPATNRFRSMSFGIFASLRLCRRSQSEWTRPEGWLK